MKKTASDFLWRHRADVRQQGRRHRRRVLYVVHRANFVRRPTSDFGRTNHILATTYICTYLVLLSVCILRYIVLPKKKILSEFVSPKFFEKVLRRCHTVISHGFENITFYILRFWHGKLNCGFTKQLFSWKIFEWRK